MKSIFALLLFICCFQPLMAQDSTATPASNYTLAPQPVQVSALPDSSTSVAPKPSTSNPFTLPVQITFIDPMGTNGLSNRENTNVISFNILAGVSGALNGIEVGGFLNVLRKNSYGLQASGFANVDLQNFTGLQAAGFMNTIKDTLLGMQYAGFLNYCGSAPTLGLQWAGFANVNYGAASGAQFAGFANTTKKDMTGIQISGFSNYSGGHVHGVQASGMINYAKDSLIGAQVGFINSAGDVMGTQLGFINFSKSANMGTPIGFISFVRQGYHKLELSTNETTRFNAAFKTGTRKFYNQFMFSYTPGAQWYTYSGGYGIGTMFNIKNRLYGGFEVSSSALFNGTKNANYKANSLNRLSIVGTYRLGFLELFAGGSLNVYVEENTSNLVENGYLPGTIKAIYRNPGAYVNTIIYPGFTAGIRL